MTGLDDAVARLQAGVRRAERKGRSRIIVSRADVYTVLAGHVAELREARAETWDEAIATIHAWWEADPADRPRLIVNPYGVGVQHE